MNSEQVKTSVRVKARNDFSDIEVYDIVECCSSGDDNTPPKAQQAQPDRQRYVQSRVQKSPQARKPNQADASFDEPSANESTLMEPTQRIKARVTKVKKDGVKSAARPQKTKVVA